jgi:peptide/nickel transport system substrate-binding protein
MSRNTQDENLEKLFTELNNNKLSRRDFLRLAVVAGLSVSAGSFISSCTQPESTPEPTIAPTATTPPVAAGPQKGGRIIIGARDEPAQLNPIIAEPAREMRVSVAAAIHDSLWRLSPAGEVPNLALEVPTVSNGGISADGQTYTVRLRDDVKWHDGQPFTSEDVVFSWETLTNPNVKAAAVIGASEIESMEAPDAHTVVWKMKGPYSPLITAFADFFIVPKHLLSGSADINIDPYNSAPVGTGPFIFDQWVRGSNINLKANPNYHGEGPYVDQLIFKVIPDLTVLFTQLKTGEIDITGYQGIMVDHYKEALTLPNIEVFETTNPDLEVFGFNNMFPLFEDKRVKTAIYFGIDKEPIINDLWMGLPMMADTHISRVHWAYNLAVKDYYSYDPEKAKQLLEEAGWIVGDDGIRVKDGQRLSFNNSLASGNKVREQIQQLIQQQLKEIGVEMKIDNKPPSEMWGDFYSLSQFESYFGGQGRTIGSDPDWTWRLHSKNITAITGTGYNTMAYSNPEVDRLLDAGSSEPDRAKRIEIYKELQEVLVEDLPFCPIFHWTYIEGIKKTVKGFQPNPYALSYGCWNPNEWWIKND